MTRSLDELREYHFPFGKDSPSFVFIGKGEALADP